MLPGNHDLFYRDQRTISSIAWAEHIPNIRIINEIETIDDVVFVPWLVGNESKQLFKKKGTYMFGHLELPRFLMNAMVEMPEVGELRAEQFEDYHHVYHWSLPYASAQRKHYLYWKCIPAQLR